MKKLRQILLLLKNGQSQNSICKALRCGKHTTAGYCKKAAASGLTYAELLEKTDSELAEVFNKVPPDAANAPERRKRELEELMPEILKWLRRKHSHLKYVYEEYYKKQCPNGYGYTMFTAYVKSYMKRNNCSFHNEYEPGHQWQIDFAGDPLYIIDRLTREKTKLTVLVCVMPYSNTIFMIALPNATTEWFFYGLNKGLEYLGALPKVAHTDNMRQWVSKSDRYSLTFSDGAKEWALYYDIEPTACRVRKPRDKGPVEGAVNQVYNYIYARLEGEEHNTLESINNRISELLDEYNSLPYKGSSRWRIYQEDEKPEMGPLPLAMYDFKLRKEVRVASNGCVSVSAGKGHHFYSCPFKYVGQKVTVLWSASEVQIYSGFDLICTHTRSMKPYGYTIVPEHMPPRHEAYIRKLKGQNAASFIDRGRFIGPNVGMAIEKVLASHIFPQQGYRRCEGILSLPKTYGNARVDNACRILLESNLTISCQSLKDMLKNNRDLDEGGVISCTPYNNDVRGPEAFMLDEPDNIQTANLPQEVKQSPEGDQSEEDNENAEGNGIERS